MAMQLSGHLEMVSGVNIGIGRLMQDGSPEGIAKYLDSELKGNESGAKKPCVRGFHPLADANSNTVVFGRVTAGQESLFAIWRNDPSAMSYTTTVNVEMDECDTELKVWVRLERLVKRHSAGTSCEASFGLAHASILGDECLCGSSRGASVAACTGEHRVMVVDGRQTVAVGSLATMGFAEWKWNARALRWSSWAFATFNASHCDR